MLIVDPCDRDRRFLQKLLRARGFQAEASAPEHEQVCATLAAFDLLLARNVDKSSVRAFRTAGFAGAILVASRHDFRIPDTVHVPFPALYPQLEVAILRAIPGSTWSILPMDDPYGICVDDRVLERLFVGVELTTVRSLLRAKGDFVPHDVLRSATSADAADTVTTATLQTLYVRVHRLARKLALLGVPVATEPKQGYSIPL